MNHLLRLWILECLIVAISLSTALVLDFMLVLFPVLSCTILVLVTCGYLAQVLLTSLLASKQNQFKFRIFIVSPTVRYLFDLLQSKKNLISSLELRTKKLENRAKKRAEKLISTARELRKSLYALPDPLVVLDQNNRIEWWNRTAEDMLGLSAEDEKKRIEVIIGSEEFRIYTSEFSGKGTIDIASPTEGSAMLSVQITSFGDGQKLLQARDVTRIRQLEKVRQDFVANASHELRTPLTVVHGYLESLMDNKIEEEALLSSLLNRMYQQTTRIKGIVEDMLTLSRLEQESDSDYQSVDMFALLEGMRQEATILSGEKCHSITLHVEPGYVLKSNLEDIRSLVSNLTSNAIRYTPAHGNISLNWRVEESGGFFSVTDTGIGIEAAHITRITERFYRVDVARSRELGGTGLGLAIVKHVVVRMGGELSITSEPGIGSTFTCFFPSNLVYSNEAIEQLDRLEVL